MPTSGGLSLQREGTGTPEFEDVLYSDVQFRGEQIILGPYSVITTIPDVTPMMPSLVLRGETLIDTVPDLVNRDTGDLEPADSSAYHGGTATDEIAALLSLTLGVRCRAGGTTREWKFRQDPNGSPVYWNMRPLYRPGPPKTELLPRVASRTATLAEAKDLLETFPKLPPTEAIALIRAARLYSNGLWWANEDANFAWLQLVGAVEVIAGTRGTPNPGDLASEALEYLDSEILTALDGANDEVKSRVSEVMFRRSRSTRKFLGLVTEYLPAAPAKRPEEFARVEWSQMDAHMRKIYNLRSRALHDGTPFPHPMLNAPRADEQGRIDERPLGMSAGALGASWMADEYPMTLQTFEHIVRGCILGWWSALG